jgi:hypothetical protein
LNFRNRELQAEYMTASYAFTGSGDTYDPWAANLPGAGTGVGVDVVPLSLSGYPQQRAGEDNQDEWSQKTPARGSHSSISYLHAYIHSFYSLGGIGNPGPGGVY